MNATEPEARRLLAAGTTDMPQGIDLLDGFEAARRRDRTRRTRRRAGLSAAITVAAGTVAAVALTVGSAPPALATVTSALSHTLAQSYHASDQTSEYYIVNGRVRFPSHGTCTSEADPVRHLEESSCGTGGIAGREVGKYSYFYFPGHPGRHWGRMATRSVTTLPSPANFANATPQQMLAEIKKAEKVTVVGPVSGPGWTGTRYAFDSVMGSGRFPMRISGTVDVDNQGRARALVFTVRSTSAVNVLVTTQTLTFTSFGTPVAVTPPPADQTFNMP